MLKRSLIGLVCVIGLLAVPSAASAANSCDAGIPERTWEGDVSSDWFDGANWTGGVPGGASDVCTPASTPTPPVIGTGSPALAASIESFQQIDVNSGSLRVTSTPQASLLHDDL